MARFLAWPLVIIGFYIGWVLVDRKAEKLQPGPEPCRACVASYFYVICIHMGIYILTKSILKVFISRILLLRMALKYGE